MKSFRLALVLLIAGCGDWAQPDGFTERDVELIAQLVLPSEPPPDPTNPLTSVDAAVELGQQLFFDVNLSNPPGVSCASCHDSSSWFIDTASKPNNVSLTPLPDGGMRVTKRNSPSLVNVAHYRWWGWDGRSDSLWMQCAVAYEAAGTMAGTRERLNEVMRRDYDAGYRLARTALGTAFDALPAPEPDKVAAVAYMSLAAYLTRLNSANAPFDRFALGDTTALSPDAKKGLKLFIGKAGCIECHNGPAFNGVASAENERDFYHSVAVAQRGDHVESVDNGRYEGLSVLLTQKQSVFNSGGPLNLVKAIDRVAGLEQHESDKGLFRIKSLRQVAKTAPYMHAGQLPTLESVVHHYNTGGDASGYAGERDRVLSVELGMTPDEEQQLVAFLESLTGDPIPLSLSCDLSVQPKVGSLLCSGMRVPPP